MNLQSVVDELSLREIALESFTHLHFADWLQRRRLQFRGRQIFHAPDFRTHLSAHRLAANLAPPLAQIQI
jgi:hypothetical protein